MDTAKIFTNGRSQAVRLPKEYRFDEDEVYIRKWGDMVILYPRKKGWDLFFEAMKEFPDDFMRERMQPRTVDKRKPL
jgi:antitoxin VapB